MAHDSRRSSFLSRKDLPTQSLHLLFFNFHPQQCLRSIPLHMKGTARHSITLLFQINHICMCELLIKWCPDSSPSWANFSGWTTWRQQSPVNVLSQAPSKWFNIPWNSSCEQITSIICNLNLWAFYCVLIYLQKRCLFRDVCLFPGVYIELVSW